MNPWIGWGGAAISHFQGLISALVVFYTSDDIRREMILVLRCNFSDSGDPQQEPLPYSYRQASDTKVSNRSDRSLDEEESGRMIKAHECRHDVQELDVESRQGEPINE